MPYNLCVLTAGCPPWKEERPIESLLRSQTDQTKEEYHSSRGIEEEPVEGIRPDIDYAAIVHRPQVSRTNSESALSVLTSRKGTVRRALSTLGNMPELHHPRPKRASYHEILVHGYGNGTNSVSITAGPHADEEDTQGGKSPVSTSSSSENLSSRWSNTSDDAQEPPSPTTSVSSDYTRRGSAASTGKKSIREFLDRPMSARGLRKAPSSTYTASVYGGESIMQPEPLHLRKGSEDHYMMVTKAVTVQWEEDFKGPANEELQAYLNAN